MHQVSPFYVSRLLLVYHPASIMRPRVPSRHNLLSDHDLSVNLRSATPVEPSTVIGLRGLVLARLWPRGARPGEEGALWLQAVSVGEVEIAATLAEAFRAARPRIRLLATASTPAGVNLLARRLSATTPFRPFPLDLPFSVGRFFKTLNPRLLVLIETELWPVVLAEAGRRATPVVVASGRLSERSLRRYRALRPLLRRPLAAVTRVCARSAADAARFAAIGIPEAKISITGDLKFDRPAPQEPDFAADLRRLACRREVLVAGSVADEELPLILQVARRLRDQGRNLLLVLAPRRPEAFERAAQRAGEAGFSVARRSRLGQAEEPRAPDVFVLDSIGELAGAYRLGEMAILGGTFAPRGGHNVLEPLRAGLPTIHGPSAWNIRPILEEAAGAVFEEPDAAAVATRIGTLLDDPAARKRGAEIAASLFVNHGGATRRVVETVLDLLGPAFDPERSEAPA